MVPAQSLTTHVPGSQQVRHGERLDEADRTAWRGMLRSAGKVRGETLRHDPPLTAEGDQITRPHLAIPHPAAGTHTRANAMWPHARKNDNETLCECGRVGAAQAHAAGAQLRALMATEFDALAEPVHVSIYTSPLARTVATAAELATELDAVADFIPHHGLNCCAAAKKYGCSTVCGQEPAPTEPEWWPGAGPVFGPLVAQLSRWPPAGDPGLVDRRHRGLDGATASPLHLKTACTSHDDRSRKNPADPAFSIY